MPIDRPREPPEEHARAAGSDTPQEADRPRPRDAPPPHVDQPDRHEPAADEPSPDIPAPLDGPRDTDGGRPGSTWAQPGEDPQARYERARDDTAAGDALLDAAVRSLTAWTRDSTSVAAYWRTGRETQQPEPDTDARTDRDADKQPDGEIVSNGWNTPEVKEHPKRPDQDAIHLDDARSDHMLDRHRSGTGLPGKTEFPADWSDEKIQSSVVDVARSPDEKPYAQNNGRWYVTGKRDEVTIAVAVHPDGRVLTGYPVPGSPGVVQNPREPQ